ncbi:hypothetical protein COOONC_21729 [Cooperia oncophora]
MEKHFQLLGFRTSATPPIGEQQGAGQWSSEEAMRILGSILLLFVVQFVAVTGQDETVSDVFDVPPHTTENRDVVGPSDFLGRTEEINEGFV